MSSNHFDRDAMAHWYAREHLKTDPGIRSIHYLVKDAPDREIRFVEINELLAEREVSELEPVDFGVDTGSPSGHKLYVLDVTPAQWDMIRQGNLALRLPNGWSLDGAKAFSRN